MVFKQSGSPCCPSLHRRQPSLWSPPQATCPQRTCKSWSWSWQGCCQICCTSHGDNNDGDTDGAAFEKEPDGWEVFKDRGGVVYIFHSQANLSNKNYCPILIFVSCLFTYKCHWLELCKMLSLEFQINSFVAECQFNLSSLISNEAGSDLLHLSECQSARGNLNIWLVSIHPLVLSTPRSTVPAPVLSISSSNTSSSLPPRATGSVLNARLPIAVLLCAG